MYCNNSWPPSSVHLYCTCFRAKTSLFRNKFQLKFCRKRYAKTEGFAEFRTSVVGASRQGPVFQF